MARRPLSFGMRFREKGRTVKVRASRRDPSRYLVEVERKGARTRRSEHASTADAVRHFAQAWRDRLN